MQDISGFTRHCAAVGAIFLSSAFVSMAGASAAFCPDDIGNSPSIADNIDAAIGCQIGSTNNHSASQVNADMMFGFDDWIFAEKAFDSDEAVDIGLSIVGDTISGLWSIDDIWNTMDVSSLMLVFKGGNGQPDHFVSYLITPGATSGEYLTPFINAASGNPKDISHIAAYFRTGVRVSTSEPASLALLVLGLYAMRRFLRRRAG